ncbi:MAG: N-acetylmuramoyl-L-alanine amidase [Blastocatellia bacterium]|nr:N-acetylmuramoyl-L-alanine amidase [Blastocatellia bacterium]
MKTEIIGLQGQRISKEQASVRRISPDRAQVYVKIVERYAMVFDRPEVRLRFLNNMIAKQVIRQKKLQHALRHFKFVERTWLYEILLEIRFYRSIIEELTAAAGAVPIHRSKYFRNIRIPLTARTGFFCYRFRHALYGAGIMAVLLLAFAFYNVIGWSMGRVNNYLARVYRSQGTQVASKLTAGSGAFGPVIAGELGNKKTEPPDYRPKKVFLLDKKGNVERWSNRAWIRTEMEIDTRPRRYYAIPRGSEFIGSNNQLRHDIVGIIYHTSESHILPYDPEFNKDIVRTSQGLANYIRSKRAYNYLIDRGGDIFRIVRDDQVANHVGNSIWSDSKYTYVGLNDSFIGICFESSVDAPDEQLTEPQIKSGRELTDVLRYKYHIDDADCTTHGLVSINPERMFIAFHHDWVRDFPFDMMGVSDKYKVPPANILDYGFTYDDETLEKIGGKLWEGAKVAEERFKKRAEAAGIAPEVLRQKMRDRYLTQYYSQFNKAPFDEVSYLNRLQAKPSSPSILTRSAAPRKALIVRSSRKPKPGISRR